MTKKVTIFSVQYLRGLAALFVLLSHIATKSDEVGLGLFSYLHVGVVGVDLFFVISGFIMCHIYMMTSKVGVFALVDFWRRRVIRILPLYWLLTALALGIYLVIPSHVNSSGGNTVVWESFLLIPGDGKFLIQNGWTLSYEFYFYIIFSLAFFLKNKLAGSLLSSSVIFFLSALTILGLSKKYFFTSPIMIEFAFGIILRLLYKRYYFSIGVCCLAIVLGCIGLFSYKLSSSLFPHMRYITAGIPALLFSFGVIFSESRMRHDKMGLVGKLGDSSYSMYLFHPFPLAFFGIIFRKLNISSLGAWAEMIYWIIIGVLILLASYAVYLYVEKPIIKLARNLILKKHAGEVR